MKYGLILAMAAALPLPVYALPEDNLLTLARGATVISASANPARAMQLINGDVNDLGWHNEGKGLIEPATFVFELLVPTKLVTVGVRTADDRPGGASGGAAKVVEVEASEESADTGFQKIGTIDVDVDSEASIEVQGVKARWLRFTVTGNHGNSDWVYLREVSATGEPDPLPEGDNRFSGKFETNLGTLELHQDGHLLTGCYEGGVVLGAVQAGVARINWFDIAGEGIAGVAIFAKDSRGRLTGIRYRLPEAVEWGGPPYTGTDAICPPERRNPVKQAIDTNGSVILYGISFGYDGDAIMPLSDSSMQMLLEALREDPELKVDIQVSTDDEGGKSHNQDLAQRRAAAIAVWLTNNGIDGIRINPVGMGELTPMADNETAVGRALNRRVQIVRN